MTYEKTLFGLKLGAELEDSLLDMNPWWAGKPMEPLPPHRRWLFEPALQRLKSGLAPVTVLRGPRQVGKTILQMHMIEHLLQNEGVDPKRILRIQFDEIRPFKGLESPILSICRWFEKNIAKMTFNEMGRSNKPAFVFFDEAQNLKYWAPEVKSLVDHNSVRVMLTGSSSLRIERGRDSLAGRISTLELGTLLLREIAAMQGFGDLKAALPFNGSGEMKKRDFWKNVRESGLRDREIRDRAFSAFSERGGYPVSQVRTDKPWAEVADSLNETVIKRVIKHDLRIGDRGKKRDENLLEEVFRICCRYAGQSPGQAIFMTDLRTALDTQTNWQKILSYLRFLDETLLLRLVQPLELRLKKKRGRPKICLCDHSLRASWLQEIIPLTPEGLQANPHLSDLAGHLAESVAGYFLGGIPGLDLAWFPERGAEPEVDFVITVGEFRIPVEIKYRRQIHFEDTRGLRSFLEKTAYNAPFGLLVTLDDEIMVDDPRILALPLSTVLLIR